jgi:hypothetical protein
MNKIENFHQPARAECDSSTTAWADAAHAAYGKDASRVQPIQKVADSDLPTHVIDGVAYPVTRLPEGKARNGFRGDSSFQFGYGNLAERPNPKDVVIIFENK